METKLSDQVKFDDFEKNLNLLNVPMNLVGIIAKIGELRYANGNVNEDSVEILSIRDLHVYDDTFTMVRLILRDHLAENCERFKVNDVLCLKNVKIQKVQNRLVMITSKDTVIDVNTAAYKALWLKQWFLHNKKDIIKNNYAQFKNLSMTPAKPKEERVEDVTLPAPRESPPAKVLRVSPQNRNISQNMEESSKVGPSVPLSSALLTPSSPTSPSSPLSPRSPSSPLSPRSPSYPSSPKSPSSPSSPRSPSSSSLPLVNIKSEFVNNNYSMSTKCQENTSHGFVVVTFGNDNDKRASDQNEKKEESKGEVTLSNEQMEIEVEKEKEGTDNIKKQELPDSIKADVRFETYHALMHSPFLENDWDEEKDQYLVNFITKNSCNLQNDSVYNKLLIEQPEVFAKITSVMLKERVFMLSSVKNYLYLMKLCGGDHLTTEKEKDTFIVKVERLRESMRLIKIP